MPKLSFIDRNAEYSHKLVRLQITIIHAEKIRMSRGEIVTNLEEGRRVTPKTRIIFSELALSFSLSFVM